MARRTKKHMELENDLKYAVSDFVETMNEFNIHFPFIVKIKHFSGYRKNMIALYRSKSQIRSVATFWINNDLYNIMKGYRIDPDLFLPSEIITDSLYHESAHVICEWAEIRDYKLMERINNAYSDEEELAENLVGFFKGEHYIDSDEFSFEELISEYVSSVQEFRNI